MEKEENEEKILDVLSFRKNPNTRSWEILMIISDQEGMGYSIDTLMDKLEKSDKEYVESTVRKDINNRLIEFDLIEETDRKKAHSGDSQKAYKATEKGKIVAEKLKEIKEILTNFEKYEGEKDHEEWIEKWVDDFTSMIDKNEVEDSELISKLRDLRTYIRDNDAYIEVFENNRLLDELWNSIEIKSPAMEVDINHYLKKMYGDYQNFAFITYLNLLKEGFKLHLPSFPKEEIDRIWEIILYFYINPGNYSYITDPEAKKKIKERVNDIVESTFTDYYTHGRPIEEEYLIDLLDALFDDTSKMEDSNLRDILVNKIKNRKDMEFIKKQIEEEIEEEGHSGVLREILRDGGYIELI